MTRLVRCRLPAFLAVAGLLATSATRADAHEPVFSLGPETIYEGGVGVEAEFEFEDATGEEDAVLHYEVIYGVKENFSLTVQVPHVLEREEGGDRSSGLGDVEVRAKYRFFKKDLPGAQHKVSGIFGVKAPTGDEDAEPRLGTGTTDFLFGGSYGYESRTW